MSINHETLAKITVKNQNELDAIPLDFKGTIYIEFGTYDNRAIIKNKYYQRIVAHSNSSVVAYGNSSVAAYGNSSVVAHRNSSVIAYDNSSVIAYDNSSVVAYGNSSVAAYGNSSVEAYDNSSVVAYDNSSVVAYGNSFVEAYDNSSVVAYGNSSVIGSGNSQIVDNLSCGRIEITGNSRIVYNPKTIEEYCRYYNINHDEQTGRFFKCVHKRDGEYFSAHDTLFQYVIGEKVIPDSFDNNINEDCGHGIHIAHLNWVLNYGRNWDDLAIIEVEANLADIVVPKNCDGKIRCKEVTVIREVPLQECGLLGKILAKKRSKNKVG